MNCPEIVLDFGADVMTCTAPLLALFSWSTIRSRRTVSAGPSSVFGETWSALGGAGRSALAIHDAVTICSNWLGLCKPELGRVLTCLFRWSICERRLCDSTQFVQNSLV